MGILAITRGRLDTSPALRWIWNRLGLALWMGFIGVVLAITFARPDFRSVIPAYRAGVELFVTGRPLYDPSAPSGYLYSPAFSVLFRPFAELGSRLGAALWQAMSFTLLTYATAVQVGRLIKPESRVWAMSVATFLALPLTAGAVRNGQATILLAATTWLLMIAAAEKRPAAVLGWSALALIAKPTAIVPVLLAGAVWPVLLPWLAAGLGFSVLIPFAFAPPGYVAQNTVLFGQLLAGMSTSAYERFKPADFTAVLDLAGVPLPDRVTVLIRALFALLTLSGAWLARRRIGNPGLLALAVTCLVVFYMSVFNPRQESNTYAVLALPFAVAMTVALTQPPTRRLGIAGGAVLWLAGFDGIARPILRLTEFWLDPVLATLAFGIVAAIGWRLAAAAETVGAGPGRGPAPAASGRQGWGRRDAT